MNKLLLSFFCLITLNPIFGQTDNSKVKLKIFNDSYYTIDSYIISFEGVKTEFKNIKPKSYSDIVEINGFWKDNCYDITLTKKRIIGNDFWTNIKATPIDHIGDLKIIKGNFIIRISVNQENRNKIEIKTDYLEDK
jgi:hypothetical protein